MPRSSEARTISRRGLLGAGLGVGAALGLGTLGLALSRSAGDKPARSHGEGPVTMSMHTHSCFSEGGSYAGGGGGASMLAQLEQARRTGTDVVWWTDHDWRMQAYGYLTAVGFDGTAENEGLNWVAQDTAPIEGTAHAFVPTPHSPDEPGKALRISATGPAVQWGARWIWLDAGNSFYSTNLSDTTLTVDVLAEQIGPDAELAVQIETSYRPSVGDRPAGLYVLEYRVGSTASRHLDDPLTGAVTVTSTSAWQRLTITPIDDIRQFWPDVVAEDSGFARIRFGVRARNGARARGVFDRLRISRTRDRLRWPLQTQQDLLQRLAPGHPDVEQHLSIEVSMIRHMNVYMEDVQLFPYPDRGVAPALDNSVTAAKEMVDWYHRRGALVQYNHPPIDAAELVAQRAFGCDLMEIADAGGDYRVTEARLRLFDAAARNGIFLTGTSQNDDHNGRNWSRQHLFHTSVWAASRSAGDLIRAMAQGQVWLNHQRSWPGGRFDLSVAGRRAMGRVGITSASSVPVDISAEKLPSGATVQVIVGVCDRSGTATPSVERVTHAGSEFARGPLTCHLSRGDGRYLRLEAYDARGVLIGISNPLWLLPDDARIDVPEARRLVLPG